MRLPNAHVSTTAARQLDITKISRKLGMPVRIAWSATLPRRSPDGIRTSLIRQSVPDAPRSTVMVRLGRKRPAPANGYTPSAPLHVAGARRTLAGSPCPESGAPRDAPPHTTESLTRFYRYNSSDAPYSRRSRPIPSHRLTGASTARRFGYQPPPHVFRPTPHHARAVPA